MYIYIYVGRSLQTSNSTCTLACADSSVNMITKSKFPSLTVVITAHYEYDYIQCCLLFYISFFAVHLCMRIWAVAHKNYGDYSCELHWVLVSHSDMRRECLPFAACLPQWSTDTHY